MADLSIGNDTTGLIVNEATSSYMFVENFPGHDAAFSTYGNNTVSFQAVNFAAFVPFNTVAILVTGASTTNVTRSAAFTYRFGLYSLTGSTLTLVNSASATLTKDYSNSQNQWVSFVTSATSSIPPGQWYFAFHISTGAGATSLNSHWGNFNNNSPNPGNAMPGIVKATMTQSTSSLPASINTTALSTTGQAVVQPYIIITA